MAPRAVPQRVRATLQKVMLAPLTEITKKQKQGENLDILFSAFHKMSNLNRDIMITVADKEKEISAEDVMETLIKYCI